MYSVSNTFKDYIKRETVSYSWHGTIVDLDSNEYEITPQNIVQNTGKITKRCSSDKLNIGTAYAAELKLSLYLDVSRYLLFGATVVLYFTLYEGVDANDEPITEDVPMGTFIVSECEQSNGKISLIAYDVMTKFDDVPFIPTSHTSIQFPYNWLSDACTACGVTLGNTQAQIKQMPNGKRYIGYTDVAASVKTWKDVLGYIATVLGGFAYIGRDSKLYIKQYDSVSVDTIPASDRYSSELSDYRTTYEGIHHVCRETGVQEYVENHNEGGLVLDIGTNPFLQFTVEAARLSSLREIINVWNGVYYVPFKSVIPIMPHYDISDVVTFTQNQAAEYDYGAITEIVYAIGDKMSIACSGENPLLANSQDKFSKTVEGLSSEYDNTRNIGGKDFWILSITNTEALTVTNTEVQIAELEWNQKTNIQDIEMIFLADVELSATAVVTIRITIDDAQEYEIPIVSNKVLKGIKPFHGSNPQKVYGKELHTAKVYMTITDSALTVGDLR